MLVKSEGSGEELLQFVRRELDGIGLHAAGAGGFFGHGGDVGLADSIGTQGRDFEIRAQCGNPGDAVFRYGVLLAGQHAGHYGIAA